MDKIKRLSGSQTSASTERGIALLMVLWVLALLTVMATSFSYASRTETAAVRNRLDAAKARYLAEAGVQRALYALAEPDPERRWPIDGTEQEWSIDDAVVRIAIRDEAGLININRVEHDLLDGILRVIGLDTSRRQEIVDAILDWRDSDSLRRAHGAEDVDYVIAQRSYGAKDNPFESVEELQLLLGITTSVFSKLEPYLTVHGGQSGVNPAVASREVLLAMPGVDVHDAEAILAARSHTNISNEPGSASDRGSGTFRISVQAELPSGARQTLRAVIQVRSGPTTQFPVLSWKENG